MELKFKMLIAICLTLAACGKNLAEDKAEMTSEQEARALMNDGKYQEAIDILAPLVAENPDKHFRRPLLAAAYAGLAGVGVLDIILNQFDGDEGGDSVFEQVSSFLPNDYDEDVVDIMAEAVSTLNAIPSAQIGTEGDPDYGESAAFQLTLYQAVYATMYLNLFVRYVDGVLDIDALRQLSAEDARIILGALSGASDSGGGSQGAALSNAIDGTLSSIDQSEGDSDDERLQNYILSRY